MNLTAVKAIYVFEMARTFRTLLQSVVSPVLSTSLYFVVFGAAIGSRIDEVEGVSYGAFIVPGLIMLTVLTQSVSNASFGIYFPKFVGTIYELLSAPASFIEITAGYVLAAATKSLAIGLIILGTALFFRRPRHSASGLDAGLPGTDLPVVFADGVHHRHLGEIVRTITVGAVAYRDAIGVFGWLVLFNLDVAARLAKPSRCSIPLSIWCQASAGPFLARLMSLLR